MAENPRNILQQAVAAYKAGDLNRARALVQQVIRLDPQNADAWYFVSLLAGNPETRERALKKALQINPQHKRALAAMQAMQTSPAPAAPAPRSQPPPPPASKATKASGGEILTALGIVAAVIVTVVVIALIVSSRPAPAPMPTSVAVGATSQGPTPSATERPLVPTATLRQASLGAPQFPTATRRQTGKATKTPAGTPRSEVRLTTVTPLPISQTRADLPGRFLFVGYKINGALDIFTVNADGSNVRNLTRNPRMPKTNARWAPDYKQIIYISDNKIRLMDAQGKETRALALADPKLSLGEAILSPDGKQIAYSAGSNADLNLYVMNVDGSNPRQVSINARYYRALDWAPDGKAISYCVAGDNTIGLWTMNIDTGEVKFIAPVATPQEAQWSPDGKRMLFISKYELFVVDADGSNMHAVSGLKKGIILRAPTWSPDGKQIAYAVPDALGYNIYLVDANGGQPYLIVASLDMPSSLRWSPEKDTQEIAAYSPLPDPGDSLLFLRSTTSSINPMNGDQEYLALNADGSVRTLLNVKEYFSDPVRAADGRIAFVVQSNDHGRILVMEPDGGGPWQLTPDGKDSQGREFGQTAPSWSPDGRYIAYVRLEGSAGLSTLFVMEDDGSNAHQVGSFQGIDSYRVSWSPDGRRIAFSGKPDNQSAAGLFSIDVDGQNLHLITDFPGFHPEWSPDGTQIAFINRPESYQPHSLYIVDAEGRNPRRVLEKGFTQITDYTWSPDGAHFILAVSQEGSPGLYLVNADGSDLREFTTVEGSYQALQWLSSKQVALDSTPLPEAATMTPGPTASATPRSGQSNAGLIAFASIRGLCIAKPDGTILRCTERKGQQLSTLRWSPDGTRLAYVEDLGIEDIYMIDATGAQTRLTTDSAADYAPAWSPDGKTIAFISYRTKSYQVFLMNADGSNQRQISNFGADIRLQWGTLAWSPDGQSILFTGTPGDRSAGLYAMNPDGSNVRKIHQDVAVGPVFSPDGTRLAVTIDGLDNTSSIVVMDADGKNARTLTFSKARDSAPTWSPDGRFLLFSSTRDTTSYTTWSLYIMASDGADVRRWGGDLLAGEPAWSPNAPDSFVLPTGESPTATPDQSLPGTLAWLDTVGQIYTVKGGQVTALPLGKISPAMIYPTLSLSPDGQQIVFAVRDVANKGIWSMNSDGTGLRQLRKSQTYDALPTFSPDGKKIAFVSVINGQSVPVLMNRDGSGLKPLAGKVSSNGAVVWSPDGRWLAFTTGDGNALSITILNVRDGSTKTIAVARQSVKMGFWSADSKGLYYRAGSDAKAPTYRFDMKTQQSQQVAPEFFGAAWSPDGQVAVFYENGDLYAMDADGSNKRKLTIDSGNDLYPTWSPDGQYIVYIAQHGIAIMNRDGSNSRIIARGSAYQIQWR